MVESNNGYIINCYTLLLEISVFN